jgi:putative oxidoreductase
MFGPRTLSHALLGSAFIVGGVSALRAPKAMAAKAEEVGVPIAEKVGLPTDPLQLVKLNAGVQIAGGALLALGVVPRVAALALAGSLVPTTLAGHRFWEVNEPSQRQQQIIQFAKNASMLGGLLGAALDTGGRPSVFWSGRRAASRASNSLSNAAHSVADSVSGALN